jgi:tRNA pseudouridine13 synthase
MFGDAMRRPPEDSEAGTREDAVLAAAELTRDSFHAVRAIAEGTRRDAAIEVGDPTVEPHPDGLVVAFTLAAGGYATTVMREVMKAP